MNSADVLILTALTVIVLLALALLLAGAGLLVRALIAPQGGSGKSERPLDLLDRRWHLEHLVYRHHRLAGSAIVAASAFFLWQVAALGFRVDWPGSSLWTSLWWLLIAGNILNLAIGLVVAIRPSHLKPLESVANRWFPVDSRNLGRMLSQKPRLRGLLLLVGAGVALVGAGVLLIERLQQMG